MIKRTAVIEATNYWNEGHGSLEGWIVRAGDTMVEILLSLVVLGLTSVALTYWLLHHNLRLRLSTSDGLGELAINNYSQQVTAGIEADSALFTCPEPPIPREHHGGTGDIRQPPVSAAPYSPQITSIQYWSSASESS